MDPIQLGLACPHRGEKVGEVLCELCGQKEVRVDVHECEVFGKCTLRKWRVGSRKDGKSNHACVGCETNPLFQLVKEGTNEVD